VNNCCVEQYNLCINQGATFSRVFTWLGGRCSCVPVGSNGPTPVDITGYTALMQIRAFPLSTDILYDCTPDLVLGGIAGTIALTIPATDTAGFTWWQGVYDLKMTSAGGQVTTLLAGMVTVSPGVSQ
jgi:hypothetical protein